jgi:hypothetical protein
VLPPVGMGGVSELLLSLPLPLPLSAEADMEALVEELLLERRFRNSKKATAKKRQTMTTTTTMMIIRIAESPAPDPAPLSDTVAGGVPPWLVDGGEPVVVGEPVEARAAVVAATPEGPVVPLVAAAVVPVVPVEAVGVGRKSKQSLLRGLLK